MSVTVLEPDLTDAPTGTYRAAAVHGLCHTDIHAARGDWPVKPSPSLAPASRVSASWSSLARV